MIASKVRQDQVIEATQLLFLMDLMRFSYYYIQFEDSHRVNEYSQLLISFHPALSLPEVHRSSKY